jgi:glutathione S-transferase
MSQPVVHGPAYSTYTRTVRLALEEKGAGYKLDEVDILKGGGNSPEHLARQP